MMLKVILYNLYILVKIIFLFIHNSNRKCFKYCFRVIFNYYYLKIVSKLIQSKEKTELNQI